MAATNGVNDQVLRWQRELRGYRLRFPENILGIRHVAFVVHNIDAAVATVRARGGELVGEVENYEDIYRLCYARGPEGIIVELAERIG
jgi:catechol 2,3-dioxygenase-like lactoylglutathione lyase family enzyme